MLSPKKITPSESRTIRLEAPSLEALLYKWVEEFIYLIDAEQLVCTDIDVQNICFTPPLVTLEATCKTEPIDPQKHALKTHVKAMTYANLSIAYTKYQSKIRYTLDI